MTPKAVGQDRNNTSMESTASTVDDSSDKKKSAVADTEGPTSSTAKADDASGSAAPVSSTSAKPASSSPDADAESKQKDEAREDETTVVKETTTTRDGSSDERRDGASTTTAPGTSSSKPSPSRESGSKPTTTNTTSSSTSTAAATSGNNSSNKLKATSASTSNSTNASNNSAAAGRATTNNANGGNSYQQQAPYGQLMAQQQQAMNNGGVPFGPGGPQQMMGRAPQYMGGPHHPGYGGYPPNQGAGMAAAYGQQQQGMPPQMQMHPAAAYQQHFNGGGHPANHMGHPHMGHHPGMAAAAYGAAAAAAANGAAAMQGYPPHHMGGGGGGGGGHMQHRGGQPGGGGNFHPGGPHGPFGGVAAAGYNHPGAVMGGGNYPQPHQQHPGMQHHPQQQMQQMGGGVPHQQNNSMHPGNSQPSSNTTSATTGSSSNCSSAATTTSHSDTASISSSKSKGSKNSKKKRTHEDDDNNNTASSSSAQPHPATTGPYSFRGTASTGSSASTVTHSNEAEHPANSSNKAAPASSSSSPSKRATSASTKTVKNKSNMFDGSSRHHGEMEPPTARFHHHRRLHSGASTGTASSISVGGFSLASYDGPRVGAIEDAMMSDGSMMKNSKRHKRNDNKAPLVVDTGIQRAPSTASMDQSLDPEQSTRFEQLSIDAKAILNQTGSHDSSNDGNDRNLFLSLSTSPINHQADVDATPISKNTTKKDAAKARGAADVSSIFKAKDKMRSLADHRPSETPTPPVHGEMGDHMITDDHSMLNRHLRGQSFTPLPQLSASGGESTGNSPQNGRSSVGAAAFAAGIAPQLSWSIAGDTPSLGDLAEWEEGSHTNNKGEKQKARPGSTTSTETREMMISPHDFQMWKEEHELTDQVVSGTTTPLPVFFDSHNEGSENQMRFDTTATKKMASQHSTEHHQHHHQNDHNMHNKMLATNNGGRNKQAMANQGPGLKSSNKQHPGMPPAVWSNHEAMDMNRNPMGMPPTPLYMASEFRDDNFGLRSPLEADRRDSMEGFFPSYHHQHQHQDRIRNLRGRVPNAHFPPMPINIPPPMSGHLPMTSPMGLGPKAGLWSPHHAGMHPHLGSPHHMGSPLGTMAQSKRKCVPLKPPIPSKFQGDIEKMKTAQVPEFTSLVNFPAHMSQKQAVNLPEGMRCCVMCGQACPCSSGNKNKKLGMNKPKNDGGLMPRNANGQDHHMDKSGGYAMIPTQNKGLCTLCDVNVWVVVSSGLEIKWCKGCKNFRPWAAFGDKGLATKCLRCRERQREKYALQKEEKEKARIKAKVMK